MSGLAVRAEERLRDYDAEGATRAIDAADRRPLDLVSAPVAPAPLAVRRRRRPGGGLRHAPRVAPGARPGRRPDPALPVGVDLREPGRRDGARDRRQRPPDALAGGRARGAPRRAARGGDGHRPTGRRARPHAARLGRSQDPPAARPALAGPAGRRARRARRAAGARRRRGQRRRGRAHRRRLRAGRPPGEAAPAEDRTAARRVDPGRDGRGPGRRVHDPARRPGGAWRGDPGRRRGRDPGDAATGDRGRPRRGPGRRHRHPADPRAARRGRRPGAPARDPGPPPRGRAGPRRPDRGLARADAGSRSRRYLGGVADETLADSIATGAGPGGASATEVELDAGVVRLALRRVEIDG